MTANIFNTDTPNNNIGIYPAKSRLAYDGAITASNVYIGDGMHIANWLFALTGGFVVYHNPASNEVCLDYIPSGGVIPVICDIIYGSGTTLDGYSTTAQTVIWKTTPDSFKRG